MTATLDAMLAYATLGWPVIALHSPNGDACTCRKGDDCPSPAKHPRTEHGLKDATVDPDVIRSWCARWPTANVGLLTGVAFDVLDIDGATGSGELANRHAEVGGHMVGLGPQVATGRGWHLYFAPTGIGNKARLVDHVDWRGAGGYVVAPPSVHISGRHYEWEPGCGPDAPLEPVPGWLMALLAPPPRVPDAIRVAPGWAGKGDRGSYGQRALDAELATLASTPPGGRNDALNRSAFNLGQLVGGGVLDPSAVASGLLAVAVNIGLTEGEAAPTIASGMANGMQTPRHVP